MDEIRILVVDDHPLFRQGVADTLSLEPDFRVIGQAASGDEGLELIRRLRPQVAVVDVNLPGLNGQQGTRQAALEKLETRVVLLTAYDDEEQKIHAMRAGAAAYCTIEVKPEQLVDTIRNVAVGGYILGEQELDRAALERWLEREAENALRSYSDVAEPFQPLSSREMEVLTFITKGLSNKEIANLLGISHQTVKNHVTAVLRKLNVEDRTQAAIYALRRGWVRLYRDYPEVEE